jgi:hypothetical protein
VGIIRLFAMTTFEYSRSCCCESPKLTGQCEDIWAQTCPEDLFWIQPELLQWGQVYRRRWDATFRVLKLRRLT